MKFRELLALFITLGATIGLVLMFQGETSVVEIAGSQSNQAYEYFESSVLPGLQTYSWGIGLVMLLVSIAFILVGYEEDVDTTTKDTESSR